MLEGRLEHMERPKYIIPFTVSKEDCKRIYHEKLKRENYVPNWLRDAERIDSFRGIYVPYWIYNASQKGPVEILATKTIENSIDKVKGYTVYGDLECEYRGVAFDASQAFEDEISEQLAPYDMRKLQEFSLAFLSGFYADIADVKEDVYMSQAEELINRATTSFIDTQPELYGYNVEHTPYASDSYHTLMGKAELAMFPVWLLTYRRNGRVAYVAINGQSGKMAAKLPIDRTKYIVRSMLYALPLYAALSAIVLLLGDGMGSHILSYVMSVIILIVTGEYGFNMKSIWETDSLTLDKGYRSGKGEEVNQWKRKNKFFDATNMWIIVGGLLGIVTYTFAFDFGINGSLGMSDMVHFLVSLGLAFFAVPVFVCVKEAFREINDSGIIHGVWWLLAAFIIQLLSFMIGVSQIIRYVAMIISSLLCISVILKLLKYHNRLTTRKLPQYKYEGGDNNV